MNIRVKIQTLVGQSPSVSTSTLPYPPVYILLCFMPHEGISMDRIIPLLVSSGFWLLWGGTGRRLEGRRMMKSQYLLPCSLPDGPHVWEYVPVLVLQLLCNCPSWHCSLPLCLQNWGGNNLFLLVNPGPLIIPY